MQYATLKKMAMAEKYVVILQVEERENLPALIDSGCSLDKKITVYLRGAWSSGMNFTTVMAI